MPAGMPIPSSRPGTRDAPALTAQNGLALRALSRQPLPIPYQLFSRCARTSMAQSCNFETEIDPFEDRVHQI